MQQFLKLTCTKVNLADFKMQQIQFASNLWKEVGTSCED